MAVGGVGGAADAGGAAAAGGGADQAQAQSDMKATFADAMKQNAAITKIQTEGNTAKRAASAVPQ